AVADSRGVILLPNGSPVSDADITVKDGGVIAMNNRYDALTGGAHITFEPGASIAQFGFNNNSGPANSAGANNYGIPTDGSVNFLLDADGTQGPRNENAPIQLKLGQDRILGTVFGGGVLRGTAQTLPGVTRIKLITYGIEPVENDYGLSTRSPIIAGMDTWLE